MNTPYEPSERCRISVRFGNMHISEILRNLFYYDSSYGLRGCVMQSVSFTLRPPDGPFEVPFSTGYQTYSGLLSALDETGQQVADALHDSPYAGFSNSGLLGPFDRNARREYHQRVLPDETYHLDLGVVHPEAEAAFEALIRAFVIRDQSLQLAHGELEVEAVSTDQTSPIEILQTATDIASEAVGVRMRFQSPTCCQPYGDVWEASPHRVHLFQHLADRWNAVVDDEELAVTLTADVLGEQLYTQATPDTYETHSIVVHRRDPLEEGAQSEAVTDGGHIEEAQGFTGTWTYKFKQASETTRTAVLALAQFAEYAGVGHHTARGAGSVTTEIVGADP